MKKIPFTKDLTRFDFLVQFIENVDALHVGGTSSGWAKNSLEASEKFEQSYADHTTPALVFAAEDDGLTDIKGSTRFCSEALGCSLVPLPISRHDVWNETNLVRSILLRETALHFAAHATVGPFARGH